MRLVVFSCLAASLIVTACNRKPTEETPFGPADLGDINRAPLDPIPDDDKPVTEIEVKETGDRPPERRITRRNEPPSQDRPDETAPDDGTTTGEEPGPVTRIEAIQPMDPPSDTVVAFYEAIKAGRLADAARRLYIPADKHLKSKLKSLVVKSSDQAQAGKLMMEPMYQRIRGQWALVVTRIDITRDDGTVSHVLNEQFTFLNGDQWQLTPKFVLADAKLQSHVDDDYRQLSSWYQDNADRLARDYLDEDR